MLKHKILALLSTLALTLGLSFLATPAHAAPYITICLSAVSDAPIRAYNNSVGKEAIIWPDWYDNEPACVSFDNYGGNARVDVNPEISGAPDIDSWQKRQAGGSYGTCYHNEDSSSNPYNGTTTYYRNSEGSDCQGF